MQTLSTNWRSDAALLDGLDRLMGGAALGEPEIVVRPVRADQVERRLSSTSAPESAVPVRVRVIPHPPDADRVASVATHRPRIVADLVADITAALASDLELDLDGERRRAAAGRHRRPGAHQQPRRGDPGRPGRRRRCRR